MGWYLTGSKETDKERKERFAREASDRAKDVTAARHFMQAGIDSFLGLAPEDQYRSLAGLPSPATMVMSLRRLSERVSDAHDFGGGYVSDEEQERVLGGVNDVNSFWDLISRYTRVYRQAVDHVAEAYPNNKSFLDLTGRLRANLESVLKCPELRDIES